MRAGDEAVVQIDDNAQLGAHVLVLIVGRRLEGAIGQYQMAFLAERREGGDQLRIVEFIQGGENLAAALLYVVQQRQNFWTPKSAELVPQRVARSVYLGDQVSHLRIFAEFGEC